MVLLNDTDYSRAEHGAVKYGDISQSPIAKEFNEGILGSWGWNKVKGVAVCQETFPAVA